MSAGYQVRLEVFEGPFDLLLQLIARRRLEVTQVDLADITAEFLSHLELLEELDLDTATRFLVVAATLVELKAARLLPAAADEEAARLLDEARDVLYARLLEYRAFRDVAGVLGALAEEHRTQVGRDVPLEPRFRRLAPATPLAVSPDELARLAATALRTQEVPTVDLAHLRRTTTSVRAAARILLGRLEGRTRRFAEVSAGRPLHERVALFLAALELYKLGRVELEQPDLAGALRMRLADDAPPGDVDPLGDEETSWS